MSESNQEKWATLNGKQWNGFVPKSKDTIPVMEAIRDRLAGRVSVITSSRQMQIHPRGYGSVDDLTSKDWMFLESVNSPREMLPRFGDSCKVKHFKKYSWYWQMVHDTGIPKKHIYIGRSHPPTRTSRSTQSGIPMSCLVELCGDPPNKGLQQQIMLMAHNGDITLNRANREWSEIKKVRETAIEDLWRKYENANPCVHCEGVHKLFLGFTPSRMCYMCTLQDCPSLHPISGCIN